MNGSAVAKQEIELEETKSLKINIPVFGNKYFLSKNLLSKPTYTDV